MLETNEVVSLEILTFWVGPFLLGVEACQIALLPKPSQQETRAPSNETMDELTMLDLRVVCGLEPSADDTESQLLLVNRAGDVMAYIVDRIRDLIKVEVDKHIRPLPPLLEVQKGWQQLWGVCQWGDELVLLVDLQYDSQNDPKEG